MKRRNFLEFMGKSGVAIGVVAHTNPLFALSQESDSLVLSPVSPSSADAVRLSKDLDYKIIAKWGDAIFPNGDTFGFNNDYLDFLPIPGKKGEFFLWVNHEYVQPMFSSGFTGGTKTLAQVDIERKAVGGSILHVRKDKGKWTVVKNSKYNKRIDGTTPIPFFWDKEIAGTDTATGTLGNCAGGKTPWGTFLTCEENYQGFYGESVYDKDGAVSGREPGHYQWEKHYPKAQPEHYGWVTEIDPVQGTAQKLVALGRFCHECATIRMTKSGFPVVYMGDDANDQCIYKFVSSEKDALKNMLKSGTLYVANMDKKEWIAVDYEKSPILQKHFKDQTEVLIRCREAAKILGGTPMDRPEDIEVQAATGHVFISLTNNKPKGNMHGSILKIMEEDPSSTQFEWEEFMAGSEAGFSCPDNLEFDPKGNLWLTTDISGSSIGKGTYEAHGNNSLFMIPFSGPKQGKVIRVATAPNDAEFTGPKFAPDGKTLFLSIQHPGEQSKNLEELTSHFPDGKGSIPKSCVIAISGNPLTKLLT